MCGPYGTALLPEISPETSNILAIAGGTGVSLTLPVVLAATASPSFAGAPINFVWIIRRAPNTQWISRELDELKRRAALQSTNLRIKIFVTQEDSNAADSEVPIVDIDEKDNTISVAKGSSSGSEISSSSIEKGRQSNFSITYLTGQRPSLQEMVEEFIESRASSSWRTRVIASGPASSKEPISLIPLLTRFSLVSF
jgi:NAD(P)H-flavin reductase